MSDYLIWPLRSIFDKFPEQLFKKFVSWVFHVRALLGRRFLGFILSVLEYCPAVWCLVANIHFKLLDLAVSGARFLTGGGGDGECLTVALFIADLWQYCVWFIRSGFNRCTLFMVLNLCRMCQCGLYVVLLSHVAALMHRLAAEPRFIARPLFPSQCPCGTIFLTDGVGLAGFKSRANALSLA